MDSFSLGKCALALLFLVLILFSSFQHVFALTSYEDDKNLICSEPPVLNGDGDIWVIEGYYNIWDSEDLNDNGVIDEADFYQKYPKRELFMETAFPVQSFPISSNGLPIGQNLYVLDHTELFFGDLDLGTGGVYSFGDSYCLTSGKMKAPDDYGHQTIAIRSGSLKAGGIHSQTAISIGSDDDKEESVENPSIHVRQDMSARFEITIFGGNVAVDGAIETFNAGEPGTVYIFGGKVNAGVISSTADLYIGDQTDSFGTNKEIQIQTNTMITCGSIFIEGGVVYAKSLGCRNDFFIADRTTLFNAINYTFVKPENGAYYLCRTKLTGLVPNRTATIHISNESYRAGVKTFTMAANSCGELFVWLLPGDVTSAAAIYIDSGTLPAKAAKIGEDGGTIVFSGGIDATNREDSL